MSQESLTFRGTLKGHAGWVTAISTTLEAPDTVLSASRDKSIIIWHLTRDAESFGVPHKMMKGCVAHRVVLLFFLSLSPSACNAVLFCLVVAEICFSAPVIVSSFFVPYLPVFLSSFTRDAQTMQKSLGQFMTDKLFVS